MSWLVLATFPTISLPKGKGLPACSPEFHGWDSGNIREIHRIVSRPIRIDPFHVGINKQSRL
jgi:hypothetical protein